MATATLQQAYRSVCVPYADRLDIQIPNEYIGREVEVIVFPSRQQNSSNYNAETLTAMQETLDIMSGKTQVKKYATVEEMNADIDAETNY